MKRKIYLCPKCGRALNFSDNPEYTFQCFDCDEDFYEFEAEVKEQARMEGITDYTQLVEASIKVKEITDTAIEESKRYIEVKGTSIAEQIAEYIYETIKPILVTPIHKHYKFRDSAAIYNRKLKLKFTDYQVEGVHFDAALLIDRTSYGDAVPIIYFKGSTYSVESINESQLIMLAEHWQGLKESMNRMIPYALRQCDESNQRSLEKQKEMSEVIDSFRL
jgi:hypothetical protein